MKTELILMRHGIAQELLPGMNDEDRSLTQQGIEEILAGTGGLRAFIRVNKKLVIWYSPLLRSRQTAELLQKAMPIDRMECHAFIAEGGLKELVQALESLHADEQALIVGHEPHLSNWTQDLADIRMTYKKGGAAGFEFSQGMGRKIRLLWLCQPKVLCRLGKKEGQYE